MKKPSTKTASVVGLCALLLVSCVLQTAVAFQRAGTDPKTGKKLGK
jgi:hypothetical protein